jgi:hypothetical protein
LAGDEKDIEIAASDGLASSEGEELVQGTKSIFPDHDIIQERQIFRGKLFDDNDNLLGTALGMSSLIAQRSHPC